MRTKVLIGLLTGLALVGCSAPAEVISGEPETLLPALIASVEAKQPTDERPAVENEAVTAENTKNAMGLTPEQFSQNVVSAWQSMNLISVNAETTVLVKAKDSAAATETAKLIADGFDSHKWICVRPERSLVMTAGSYVLLTVGTVTRTQAIADAFGQLAQGKASEPNVFFTNSRQPDDGNIIEENGDVIEIR